MGVSIGPALSAALSERFELEDELGRGGMGVVLLARERGSRREVALKLMLGSDPARRARFLREGELAARLDHAGIVRVLATGEAQGTPWLACELVRGARPLDRVFAALRPLERAGLVLELARALGHAHARGVVHRDVKPANVLVDEAGRVRLTDFGVAAAEDVERLTRTGAVIGTPTYMSPEQLEGRRVGPAADVWAAGVLLYEALTGRRPFPETELLQLSAAVAGLTPPTPRALAPGTPPALEAVCLRALEKDPARRIPDGDALARELEQALRLRSRGPGVGLPALAAAAVACGSIGLLAWLTADPGSGLPAPAASAAPASALPAWFAVLTPDERPPLPAGFAPADAPDRYRVRLANGHSLELVWIRWSQEPGHGFFLGVEEVRSEAMGLAGPGVARGVSWVEAEAFCRSAGLRLPTLAEWRRAAALGPETGCAQLADGVREWVEDSLARDPGVDPRWRAEGVGRSADRALDERLVCGGTDREPGLAAPSESRVLSMLGPEDVGLRVAGPVVPLRWKLRARGFDPNAERRANPFDPPARSFEQLEAAGGPSLEVALERLDLRLGMQGLGSRPEAAGLPGAAEFPVDWVATRATATPLLERGRWALVVHADDAVRAWIDERLVIDAWRNGVKAREHRFVVEARREVALRLEHVDCTYWSTLEAWLERLP